MQQEPDVAAFSASALSHFSATALEQMKRIRKWAKESGTKINGWTSDGFGGVRAIVDSTLTNRKEA
ncbi:MAG: hypothetical protein QGF49_08215 [Candidatus Marinimicrobia bacterium]|nr:hypothetical protein [Candidatus Neomarinimicrobiota bacterium]